MRTAVILRLAWTLAVIILVQTTVCGLAVMPAVGFWYWLIHGTATAGASVRIVAFSVAVVPSYVLFALGVMAWSACATRLVGDRSPRDVEMRIVDFDWNLLRWARYMVAIHLVRLFAGALFRGSPVWSAYLRLNGARIGRRAYVNTTFISDHNLLDFGDDVVIGADVHVSGHTVEAGIVKTASVRLGRGVTVGLGSVIDIDVEAGDHCQIGALSLVPKHSKLEAATVYAGIPVRPID